MFFISFCILFLSILIAGITESYKPLIVNIIIPFLVYFGIVGIPFQIGSGNHTGIITAIDTSGIFVKSTTVYFKTDVNSSQEDAYCLKDEALLPTLHDLQEKKQVVTLSYKEYFANGMECTIEAGQVIISVK